MGYYDAAQILFDSSRGRFIAGGVWHWVWCWEISHFPALSLMLHIYFSQSLLPCVLAATPVAIDIRARDAN